MGVLNHYYALNLSLQTFFAFEILRGDGEQGPLSLPPGLKPEILQRRSPVILPSVFSLDLASNVDLVMLSSASRGDTFVCDVWRTGVVTSSSSVTSTSISSSSVSVR